MTIKTQFDFVAVWRFLLKKKRIHNSQAFPLPSGGRQSPWRRWDMGTYFPSLSWVCITISIYCFIYHDLSFLPCSSFCLIIHLKSQIYTYLPFDGQAADSIHVPQYLQWFGLWRTRIFNEPIYNNKYCSLFLAAFPSRKPLALWH